MVLSRVNCSIDVLSVLSAHQERACDTCHVQVAHGKSAEAAAAAAVAEPADGGAAAAKEGYDEDEDVEGAAEGDEAEDAVGILDESLELCVPLVEADLFGQVGPGAVQGSLMHGGHQPSLRECPCTVA